MNYIDGAFAAFSPEGQFDTDYLAAMIVNTAVGYGTFYIVSERKGTIEDHPIEALVFIFHANEEGTVK